MSSGQTTTKGGHTNVHRPLMRRHGSATFGASISGATTRYAARHTATTSGLPQMVRTTTATTNRVVTRSHRAKKSATTHWASRRDCITRNCGPAPRRTTTATTTNQSWTADSATVVTTRRNSEATTRPTSGPRCRSCGKPTNNSHSRKRGTTTGNYGPTTTFAEIFAAIVVQTPYGLASCRTAPVFGAEGVGSNITTSNGGGMTMRPTRTTFTRYYGAHATRSRSLQAQTITTTNVTTNGDAVVANGPAKGNNEISVACNGLRNRRGERPPIGSAAIRPATMTTAG